MNFCIRNTWGCESLSAKVYFTVTGSEPYSSRPSYVLNKSDLFSPKYAEIIQTEESVGDSGLVVSLQNCTEQKYFSSRTELRYGCYLFGEIAYNKEVGKEEVICSPGTLTNSKGESVPIYSDGTETTGGWFATSFYDFLPEGEYCYTLNLSYRGEVFHPKIIFTLKEQM